MNKMECHVKVAVNLPQTKDTAGVARPSVGSVTSFIVGSGASFPAHQKGAA